MTINDYEHEKEFNDTIDQFQAHLSQLSGLDFAIDLSFHIKQIIELGKIDELKSEYNFDEIFIVYHLMCLYSKYKSEGVKGETFFNYPYIKNFRLFGKNKSLDTIFGQVPFRLYVNNPQIVRLKPKKARTLQEIYYGKRLGWCHTTSMELAHDDVHCVTAFINSYLKEVKICHSYLEDKKRGEIIDVSRNLVMDKSTYHSLLEPEVVSELTGEQIDSDCSFICEYPGEVKDKDYLVNHDEVMQKVKNHAN